MEWNCDKKLYQKHTALTLRPLCYKSNMQMLARPDSWLTLGDNVCTISPRRYY